MKINDFIKEVKENANKHGWIITWDKIPTYLMLVVTELSEAMESWRDDDIPQFIEEIADSFIRLGHLCGDLGIDIEASLVEKMEKNKKRPYHHGRKKI